MKIELQELKSICEQLQATNGKKDKENILLHNKDNQLFKDTLYFLLNPFIKTGLSDKKINKNIGCIPDINYTNKLDHGFKNGDIRNVYEYLKENNTGRDIDISVCESYWTNFEDDIAEFIKTILSKSLKLGCDSKTVNKVFGKDFIPSFECMLAEKYFENTTKVEGKDFTITLKIDGQRCLAVKENDKVTLFSRQGQIIEGLVDVETEILNMPYDNFVLDGELTLLDGQGLPSKEQYKQTLKITRKDGEKHGIKLLVFDLLELEEFKTQNCTHTYSERRDKLKRLDDDMILTYVEILSVLYSGSDTSKIVEILDKVRSEDEEGIMLNLNDAFYEFKRTSKLLKCKVMQDADLKIIGFEEGSGRLSGTLGRINVEYKNSIVGVGSGFSDADRKYFWENQNELLGRVITVRYFEETEDKDGIKSLRFPVYVELRELGKEVSYE